MCKVLLSVTAVLCLFAGSALAQTPPVACGAATGIDFNQTALFGTWLEVARQPAASSSSCIEIKAGLLADNTTLNVNVSHSSSLDSLYMDVNESANITLITGSTAGYTVTFVKNGQNEQPIFTKLLKQVNTQDGVQWLVGCGYTQATNASTSFGYLLAKSQVNATGLAYVNNIAAQEYTDFKADNITAIKQSGCFRSSAAQNVPVISAFMAVVYLLLKAF